MLKISDLKKITPNSVTLSEQIATLKKDSPTIILRSFPTPKTLPNLEPGVEVYDEFPKTPPPTDIQPKLAYGTRPNVPGNVVINAIIAALGGGNWALHISDGSFSGYSAYEVQQFITKFESTDLLPWIKETFDCDNFASVLNGAVQGFYKGIPFGILWYGPRNPPYNWGHAVNIFYDYLSKKVYCIEPQNDGFFNFNKTAWVPWMVLM